MRLTNTLKAIRSPREIAARWIAAWGGGAAIGIANGMVREATFGRRLGERTANQISALSGIGAFAVFFWKLQRRWPIAKTPEALRIGAAWLALTVAFEFGFGRWVAKRSWRSLLDEYDLRKGRAWPLVLALDRNRTRRRAGPAKRVEAKVMRCYPCGQITARPSRPPLRIFS